MTKELLLENHLTTRRTGVPSSFVMDGVRVDMRRLPAHSAPAPKKQDRPGPKAKKPTKAKAAKATKPAKATPAE